MSSSEAEGAEIIRLSPRAAVSLTYDGGDPSHQEVVLGHLADVALLGTFFVPASQIFTDVPAWQAASATGHEIGNGALMDIDLYSAPDLDGLTRLALDVWLEDQEALTAVLGGEPLSYAFPWDTGSLPDLTTIRNVLADRVAYCRSGLEGWNLPGATDVQDVRIVMAVDYSADQLIALTELAQARRSWIVFAFAGVGVGNPGIDAAAHRAFTEWLRHDSQAWVAPFSEVAEAWAATSV